MSLPSRIYTSKSALTGCGFRALFYFPKGVPHMSNASKAQIAANRANSQLSSGPKTEAGKAKSSVNAVKSALTGRTVLLPTDEVPAYELLIQSMIDLYHPASYEENLLVQSLADTDWRLRRIPGLEAGIYALGRLEAADTFAEYPELIDAQTFLKHKREVGNLSIQEVRLRRMREKDLAQLRQIQAERAENEQQKKDAAEPTVPTAAVALFMEAKRAAAGNPSLNISEIGFDFANSPQPAEKAA
jgi:hypothetical protein